MKIMMQKYVNQNIYSSIFIIKGHTNNISYKKIQRYYERILVNSRIKLSKTRERS